jgi:hypothetical protein
MSAILSDDISPQGEVLESAPAQESPRPRQRWAKIMTVVTILNKKPQATPPEISQTPSTESCFGMTYVPDNLLVEADIEMCPTPMTGSSSGMVELPYELWDWC